MRQPCELFVVDRLLPTLRGEIARTLHRRGMREADIADRLGVTQATVSHYMKDRRGEGALLDALPNMPEFASLIASEIAAGAEGRGRAALICEACGALRAREAPSRATLRRAMEGGAEAWKLAPNWRRLAPRAWTAQPCELVAAKLLPLLRERTAIFLRDRHGMSQQEISEHLQVSQSVVSRYLGSKARDDQLGLQFPELDARAGLLANLLASGMRAPSSVASVCTLCTVAWTGGSGCQCPKVYPSLKPLALLEPRSA